MSKFTTSARSSVSRFKYFGRISLTAVVLFGLQTWGNSNTLTARNTTLNARALEQLWTYRGSDGLVPAGPGLIFCITADPNEPGARNLVVGSESLLDDGCAKLFSRRIKPSDDGVLYHGAAPSRSVSFNRLDMDGDGHDEVLVTGHGGAGGTSLLKVFRVQEDSVTEIFSDSSRFGFWIFDADGDRKFEIANPGFEFDIGPDNRMLAKMFAIHQLVEARFARKQDLPAGEFTKVVNRLNEWKGAPIATDAQSGILQYFRSASALKRDSP